MSKPIKMQNNRKPNMMPRIFSRFERKTIQDRRNEFNDIAQMVRTKRTDVSILDSSGRDVIVETAVASANPRKIKKFLLVPLFRLEKRISRMISNITIMVVPSTTP